MLRPRSCIVRTVAGSRTRGFASGIAGIACWLATSCGTHSCTTSGTLSSTSETGSSEDSGETFSITSGSGAIEGCECLGSDGFAPLSYCPENPCKLQLMCTFEETTGDPEMCTLDMIALACALDVLIQGTTGRVTYGRSDGPGVGGSGGFILIREDRRAVVSDYTFFDLDGQKSDSVVRELREPAYFEGCKALTDAEAIYDCIRNAVLDETLALCAVGGPFEPV